MSLAVTWPIKNFKKDARCVISDSGNISEQSFEMGFAVMRFRSPQKGRSPRVRKCSPNWSKA
jgi:UDP-N-acetylglucosamine 2-epimerase